MRAAVQTAAGAPTVLEERVVDDPVPRAGEVLIRVEAVGVENGDLQTRRLAEPPEDDFIPGYVCTGRIMRTTGDAGFREGDRVVAFGYHGSHAELRVVNAAHCWALPDAVDGTVAAAWFIPFVTAALALALAPVSARDAVVVRGATGAVGRAVVQLAARRGARVIAAGRTASTVASLREIGAAETMLMSPPLVQQIADLPDESVTVLVDLIGDHGLGDDLACVAPGGRVVLIAADHATTTALPLSTIVLRRLSIHGCFLGDVFTHPATRDLIDAVLSGLARREWSTPIDEVFPLSAAAEAHARAEARGRIGRVVIRP